VEGRFEGPHPRRRMAAAGGTERSDGSRRRGGSQQTSQQSSRGARSPHPPKFINRLPNRLPPIQNRAVSVTARGGPRPPPLAARDRHLPEHPRPSSHPLQGNGAGTVMAEALLSSGGAFAPGMSTQNEKGPRMRNPCIRSLDTVTLDEALSYLDAANGDELGAAYTLASDRNRLDGSVSLPDETEVHHALFLLRRARGLDAPSFDLMRVQLRRRVAA
jgi:hypothetical protein